MSFLIAILILIAVALWVFRDEIPVYRNFNGINYVIKKQNNRGVIVEFSIDGQEYTYEKKFSEMALRDQFINKFDYDTAAKITFQVTHNPEHLNLHIDFSKGVVISGPQGSGKGIVSKYLAGRFKPNAKVYHYDYMPHPFMEPADVWIFDGVALNKNNLSVLKQLVYQKEVIINQKGKSPFMMKTPWIIVVVQAGDSFPKDSRRFQHIEL